MGVERRCKRCLLSEVSKADYLRIVERGISALNEADKVSNSEYQSRLEICEVCDKLNQGTCLACGCYVEIRAVLVRGRCPKHLW